MSDDNRQVTELFAFAVISGVVLMRNWVAKKVRRHTTTITARRVVKKTHFMEKSNLTPSLFLNNRDVVTITKPIHWDSLNAPETRALMYYDSSHLHFLFLARSDTFKKAANLDCNGRKWAQEQSMPQAMWSILNDDRMEAFVMPISAKHSVNEYFAFEVNRSGLAIVSRTKFLRQFDFHWKTSKCPDHNKAAQISASVTYNDDTSTVFMFSVEMSDLKLNAGLLERGEQVVKLLLARACRCDDTGAKMAWSSWVDPGDSLVDFHRPETFGTVYFAGLK